MPDHPISGWPGRLAVAVVRSDPPAVYLASDQGVLGRVLALRLVAQTRISEIPVKSARAIRAALLDERWADAVGLWIEATGEIIDAYPDDDVWTDERLDLDQATFEIRLAPVFEGELPAGDAGEDRD